MACGKSKGPGWPCEGSQPGPQFGATAAARCTASSGYVGGWRESAMHQRLFASGEPCRTNVSPKVVPVPSTGPTTRLLCRRVSVAAPFSLVV